MTRSFDVMRRNTEKKLDEGFTFQELGADYKMDKRLKKYLKSLSDQIEENGSVLKPHRKVDAFKKRVITPVK